MVQRQPRDGPVGGGHAERVGDRVDVREDAPVREHHALRLRRGAARVLQDREPVGIVCRPLIPLAAEARGFRRQVVEGHDRDTLGRRVQERREFGVDDDEAGVRVRDATAGLVHELLDGAEAHG